ncbi:MAG TPA: transglutaminase domain-containing protein [Fulvivirga sp.]|nr:transglutaminase domain-containing protein [Fulvivirga sp.]
MKAVNNKKNLLLGLVLLVFPTIFITYPLLQYVGEHYSLLFINSRFLAVIFGTGLIVAYILHSTKLRFFLAFGLLIAILYLTYQSISNYPFTEFDAYYIANRFRINATIFVLGWFVGFGTARWRYFLLFFAITLVGISSVTISNLGELDVKQLAWLFAPPVFYAFYILFVKELLFNIQHQVKVNYGKTLLRVSIFSGLIFLLFWLSTQLLKSKFEEIESEIASSSESKDGKGNNQNKENDSMLEKNSKNLFRLKQYTELRPRLDQSDELLFCAFIDNFFAKDVPNPQYITLYHLNQYNVELERFEIDPDSMVNDLFLPDPTQIPNYFTQIDTTVLSNDKMDKEYKTVKSTIYINQLDPSVFVAPSTAYSCQPISVEKEFQDQYKFAYNIYSEVSNLNSAYFVYNARDPNIKAFQEERYSLLREVKSYEQEPKAFLDYYTRMPEGKIFDAISNLADSISKDANTPIDKVISIKDYFLSKKKNGEALYTYTLTPGSPTDPNIPDASLLHNFLFNTHKGYCTYFATSTLFMLRSLGIPVRMAVGFLTVDRSHNNPGWYWFYADQAHAWTQVYFPEYGWLDFDMTISNEEQAGGQSGAPQPDATPPTPPPNAAFVAKGIIESFDTVSFSMNMLVDQLLVQQKGIQLDTSRSYDFNVGKAEVYAGKESVTFKDIQAGDSALVVSFDQSISTMTEQRSWESTTKFLNRLPKVINIDEVHLDPKPEKVEPLEEVKENRMAEVIEQWVNYFLIGFAVLVVLLFAAPYLHYKSLLSRVSKSKNEKQRAVSIYKHSHFILNQLGIGRGNSTPMVYAMEKVDPKFGTNLQAFIDIYLKLKYSKEVISVEESTFLEKFYPDFNQQVLQQYTAKEKILNFLKVNRWFYFLINLNLSK